MVSRRQSILVSFVLLAAAGAHAGDDSKKVGHPVAATAASRKFLADDPLWAEPSPRPVPNPKAIEIDNLYDFIEQSFGTPRHVKSIRNEKTPAENVNTLGEVPDSEWYTNRHARHAMSIEELARGAGDANPPDPDGAWRVVSAKSDGVTPGFRIEDRRGNQYLLKLDPPDYPELASAADVIGSKIYYALGYNTPENYAIYFRREQLTLSDASSWRDKDGKKHLLKAEQIDKWLTTQPRDKEGQYRALASRWIAGKALGPFEFEGTRPDDPNDIVPHENRRELRGMRVFAAWLNDTDAKDINTLDSLVVENGVPHVKHYRIDWGASLGSDSLMPKDIRRGHDYMVAPKSDGMQAISFGFYLPKWMRVHYPSIRGTGTFDYASFDPVNWRSNYPITPFLLMDDEDAFWAAKKVMAFSDADIRAIVGTAHFSDPRATDWVTDCLIRRRDMIGKAWLPRGVALDNFRLENGRIAFDDLAEKYRVRPTQTYNVQWSRFNNANSEITPMQSTQWALPATEGSTDFLAASVHPIPNGVSAKPQIVMVYLRRQASGWSIVGVDRQGQP